MFMFLVVIGFLEHEVTWSGKFTDQVFAYILYLDDPRPIYSENDYAIFSLKFLNLLLFAYTLYDVSELFMTNEGSMDYTIQKTLAMLSCAKLILCDSKCFFLVPNCHLFVN